MSLSKQSKGTYFMTNHINEEFENEEVGIKATDKSGYKGDQALKLISSLNSGVIIQLDSIKDDGVNTPQRIYSNNLQPLLSLLQTTNFNIVELDRIVEATNKLTDSIYHPKAVFDAAFDVRHGNIEQANARVAEVAEALEVGKAIKLGVNDDYKEFIQTNLNKAFRDNVAMYAHGFIMNDVDHHMTFIQEKGKKSGLSEDQITSEQEKFMTELKSGELGMSYEDKTKALSKVLSKYSLFTEGQATKDPKSLAKDIVHSIDGFMDDIYARRRERKENGIELEDSNGFNYRPRARM